MSVKAVSSRPMPKQQKNVGIGDYMYNDLPPENVFGHTKKVRFCREAIERHRSRQGGAPLRILDIGCGSGHAVTRFLGKQGDEVFGIDMFPPNIDYAMAHFKNDGLRFAHTDVNSLSVDGRRFDIVVMSDVLEHLDNPGAVLETTAKLLPHGGRLIVTVPNGVGPFELESAISRARLIGPTLVKLTDLIVAFFNKTVLLGAWTRAASALPSDLPYNQESGHVQFFRKPRLITLVEAAGFNVVEALHLSFLSGPFTNYLFAPSRRFCDWNTRIADHLPSWLVSGWFFDFKRCDRP